MVGPVTPQRMTSGGLEEPFVGRTGELHALAANLGWAGAGEPRVVVVAGPSGIGKSALMRAFISQCGPEVQSLSASGDKAAAARPFTVIRQLLERAERPLAAVGPASNALGAGALLLEVLGSLQDEGTVVVAVDDVQWVDRPSMQALIFALRRLDADRVMVMLSRCDDHAEPEGVRQLVEARGEYLNLNGLDAVALAELAVRQGVGRLPVAAAEQFCQHTGGNPLHARALLEVVDPAELRGAGPLTAPQSYPYIVASRLERCSSATRALVAAAAVLGEHCPLPTAARLAGLDDPSAALEEAVAAHLVVAGEPTERSIRFSHRLTQAGAYALLDPPRRTALHARAAMLTTGTDALEHRVAATVGEDAALVQELADLASVEMANDEWLAAGGHFETAAALEPDISRRHRLLLDAAENHLRGGEADKAGELLDGAQADSPRGRYLLGCLALETGRFGEARRLLEASWKGDDDLSTQVSTQLARLALVQARAGDALTWGHRAIDLSERDADGRSAALWAIILGLALGGGGTQALALLDDVGRVAPELTAANAGWEVARAALLAFIGDLASARGALAVVSSTRAGGGLMRWRMSGLAWLAWTEYTLGNWDDSVGHAYLAVSLAEDADHVRVLSLCHSVATAALAARGEWDRALVHADAAARAAARSGTALDHACAASAAAQLAFARADPVAVVKAVEPLIELGISDGFGEPALSPWREQYADALVSLGHLEAAGAVLADITARAAGGGGRPSILAGAARVRGRLEAARGDYEGAESSFEEALEHLEGFPAPFCRALVEDAHGRQLRRMGQRRAAAAHLRTARTTFAHLGARPFLERCDRELAACGLAPAPAPDGAPAPLSPEELVVAGLAASGCSVQDLAAELVRTTKSTEQLLRQLYNRLGISSRHRLAAALAGRNL